MDELSVAESRLLLALKDGPRNAAAAGFASASEALVAADRLVRNGLVEVEEQAQASASLTAEGRRAAAEGLPERRVLRLLEAKGPQALEALAQAGIQPQDLQVAVGWLRRKGWATVQKGPSGTVLAASPAPAAEDEQEAALRDLSKAGGKVLADLAARGLVELKESKSRTLRLTTEGQGRAARANFAPADGVEVNQLTPELLAQWPSLSAAEKAKRRLRPFDFGVPVAVPAPGKPHPITQLLAEIRHVFWGMGFQEIAGDYVESAHWNMDALFIPQDHPAREMQDTFYLEEPARIPVAKAELDRTAAVHESGGGTGSAGWGGRFDRDVAQRALLRTHTTNTTIRYLAEHPKGAHKVFGLGRVFRKETMDATHLPEFTQIEGIVTEPGATFDMLVGLCRHFFGQMGFHEVRFRPAYFPYTEPSMEIDVKWNGRWMELGGCGIFRPEVTKPLGVENNVLAWGFGLERLAMNRFGLKDIRDLYVSDIEWLRTAPVR